MSQYNLEISGKFRSTNKGNVDWFYGGGEEAWLSLGDAYAGVPIAVRDGKTVGIIISGKVVEFIWHPGAVADNQLVEKSSNVVFDSNLDPQLISTGHLGSISNVTIGALNGDSLTTLVEDALFPIVDAGVQVTPNLEFQTFDDSPVEVGTLFSPNVELSYNQGVLINGDTSTVGAITGEMTQLTVTDPENTITSVPVSNTNPFTPTLPQINVALGDNIWSYSGTMNSGTLSNSDSNNPSYLNNRGAGYEVPEIESLVSSTTIPTSLLKKAARYATFLVGSFNGFTPTGVVRDDAYESILLDEQSLLDEAEITARSGDFQLTIYSPEGTRPKLTNLVTSEIIDCEDSSQLLNLPDASGVNVAPYRRHEFIFGGIGYPLDTLLSLTIFPYTW